MPRSTHDAATAATDSTGLVAFKTALEKAAPPEELARLEWNGRVFFSAPSAHDVDVAFRLLEKLRDLQLTEAEAYSERLLSIVTAAHVPVIPNHLARFAENRADLRSRLLKTGALTNEHIAKLRNSSESTARTWVTRQRALHRLFTVKQGRQALVPSILLGDDGEISPVAEAVKVLVPIGLDGWELWAWLQTPTGWLSGDIPADVFAKSPNRAMSAVHAYAEELASQSVAR